MRGPGETELPPECEEQNCPDGQTTCDSDGNCPDEYYCSGGCCIEEVIVN